MISDTRYLMEITSCIIGASLHEPHTSVQTVASRRVVSCLFVAMYCTVRLIDKLMVKHWRLAVSINSYQLAISIYLLTFITYLLTVNWGVRRTYFMNMIEAFSTYSKILEAVKGGWFCPHTASGRLFVKNAEALRTSWQQKILRSAKIRCGRQSKDARSMERFLIFQG